MQNKVKQGQAKQKTHACSESADKVAFYLFKPFFTMIFFNYNILHPTSLRGGFDEAAARRVPRSGIAVGALAPYGYRQQSIHAQGAISFASLSIFKEHITHQPFSDRKLFTARITLW